MYLTIDFETEVGPKLSLRTMTTRQYLTRAAIRSVAYAVGDDPVRSVLATDPGWQQHLDFLIQATANPHVTIVAHNASFDVRVLTIKCGTMWPNTIHCTMELAQAWSPNQPGGYSLGNLSRIWTPQFAKGTIDFATCTPDELRAYNAQDVEACRALHKIAMARLHPDEVRVQELTQNVKELVFSVDQGKITDAVTAFDLQIAKHGADAARVLGDDDAFGNESDGSIRSVKPHTLRARLLENLGFDTPTISLKRVNPENLRQNPEAAQVLESSAQVNKALSHKRRARAFKGATEIDCELTYFAAHTGRWSSRNGGRGLNLHNLPKRNPAVAKPIRSLFRLPDELCFVRGDFANVEYRVTGLITDAAHVHRLFTANPLADPYAEFWTAATGQPCDKNVKADQPKRQLAKAAVLGLGYMMGQQRWTDELLRSISDPTFKVTLQDLEAVCTANGWICPSDQRSRAIITKLRCPGAVAAVAYYTREKFHQVHPEFGRSARAIEQTVIRAMSLGFDPPQAQRTLDQLHLHGVRLSDDRTLQGQTVRAICGPWPAATVAWRDLLVRQTPIGTGPTFVRAGSKPVAKFSVNIGIENLVQSAARNALCMGLLELDRRGYPYVLHVHDEVMIVTERTCQAVTAARQALLDVFGPGGWISKQGWDWSVLINPAETTISQSLWDDEKLAQTLWPRIAAGEAEALKDLP